MAHKPIELSEELLAKLRRAAGGEPPAGAVVLGSGLGGLLEAWPLEASFQAGQLPGQPRSTVAGHAGRTAVVRWGPRRGLVFQGRVHFYEGLTRADVTWGVRVAAALGCRWVLLTNAAGACDPRLVPGTIMVVEDHIRLALGGRAAAGASAGQCLRGSPYHPRRTEQLFAELGKQGLRVVRGVLFGGLGPSYETAAEVEVIRRMGGQGACMSTVIEAEEAARLDLEVAAVSLVTNLATGLSARPLDHEEVVAMAGEVGPRLAAALAQVLTGWACPAEAT